MPLAPDVSSCVDVDWVMSHFIHLPDWISVVIGRGPSERRGTGVYPSDRFPHMVEVCSPQPTARAIQHIKLQIYFHEKFTRFVIPTANLMSYDYSHVENAAWIYDIPVLPANSPRPPPTHYVGIIARTLTELGIPREYWVPGLATTDLARSKDERFRLVLSIPGSWSISDPAVTNENLGHLMIAKGLRELGLTVRSDEVLEVEAQGSSIGGYGSASGGDFLRRLYRSMLGLSLKQPFAPASPFDRRKPPSQADEPPQGSQSEEKPWTPPHDAALKVIFPSLDTVQGSWGGTDGAHTLFFEWRDWNEAGFPKAMMHDGLSKREGCLMHVKQTLGVIRSAPGAEARATWLMIGSHNLTGGAWGRVKAKTRKGIVQSRSFDINNYELSVITALNSEDEGSELVTWKRPCTPLAPGQLPWFQRTWERDQDKKAV